LGFEAGGVQLYVLSAVFRIRMGSAFNGRLDPDPDPGGI
jgi:hypothetical protein